MCTSKSMCAEENGSYCNCYVTIESLCFCSESSSFFRFLPSRDYAALKIKYRFEQHDWRHCFLYIVLPMKNFTRRNIHIFGKVWRECHSRTVVILDIVEEGSHPVSNFPKISNLSFRSLSSYFIYLQTIEIMLIRDQVRWAVCLKTLLSYQR